MIMNKYFEVETYFKIIGDFNPNEVTKLLGITPNKQWKIGDVRHELENKTSVYDFSLWQSGLVKTINEYSVEKQMEQTVSPLKNKIAALNKFKEHNDVNFTLQIVLNFYSKINKPILSPNKGVIAFCYQTQTAIDYDYYFNFDFKN